MENLEIQADWGCFETGDLDEVDDQCCLGFRIYIYIYDIII